jgi:hypothetical protein
MQTAEDELNTVETQNAIALSQLKELVSLNHQSQIVLINTSLDQQHSLLLKLLRSSKSTTAESSSDFSSSHSPKSFNSIYLSWRPGKL